MSGGEGFEMVQIISLGMGVQSTALYFMSSLGELPRACMAIFADTGREGAGTYAYLDFLLKWKEQNGGIDIIVLRDKNLYEDLLEKGSVGRFVSIPAFTGNPDGSTGMLRRQCTSEYKIKIIDNYIRDHVYQLPKGSRRPATSIWHGITLDEIQRMAVPIEAWKNNTYPFLGYVTRKNSESITLDWGTAMTRQQVVEWYLRQGLPLPPKSSCIFCPYQSDRSWADKKKNHPEDFNAAIEVDEAIRNSTHRGILHPIYLHRSCRPLAEIEFDVSQNEDWGECSGNCHV